MTPGCGRLGRMRIIRLLLVLVGCSLSAMTQTVHANLDNAELTSVPVRVTRFEDPAESHPVPVDGGSASDKSLSSVAVTPVPHAETASERFQWKPAFAQYSLEIAIQHGWRFVHEPGTRDAT